MNETRLPARRRTHRALRTSLFILLTALFFVLAGALLHPVWRSWNNYDTVYGYYEQPQDVFEVAFIGPSNIISGISPMELYADYGIASYNFATEGQPMYCSLYWLKEIYRTQGETLRTVVLDVSALRDREHKESAYHKALDGMALSPVKLEAIARHTDNIAEAITFLMPLFSYHDRWSDLDSEDLQKFSYEPNTCTMGYYFIDESYAENTSYDEMWLPDGEPDEDAWEEDILNDEYLGWFDEIVTFCEENDLELILIKTPHGYWNDAYHNAVQAAADSYDLEFIDMNFTPVFDELDFNYAADTMDGAHPNYYGMLKITSYLGEYLSANGLADDVRGDADYAWMEEALDGYTEYVTDTAALKETWNLVSYLETAVSNENNTVFIVSENESAAGLTDEVRASLADLGLDVLSSLQTGENYLGIISGGSVVSETSGTDSVSDVYALSDGTKAKLTAGSSASVTIAGSEEAVGTGGLNIVVYNTTFGYVQDASVFPTRTEEGLTRDGMNLAAALTRAIRAGTLPEDMSEALQALYLYRQQY